MRPHAPINVHVRLHVVYVPHPRWRPPRLPAKKTRLNNSRAKVFTRVCDYSCNILHETLVGRWDAGTLLYNIKEQRPSPHQLSCVPWSRQIVTWGVTP